MRCRAWFSFYFPVTVTTILLVEDDETSREMLSLRLNLAGYEVVSALDGESALQQVRQAANESDARLDLVLMDMNLPKLDGWTVTKMLKADATTQKIPVIGVSAHAMSGDREKALAAGCDEYETKPIEWRNLLEKIKAVLDAGSDGA